MESDECTPSPTQAKRIRKLSDDKKLSEDTMLSIMSEAKANQVVQFKIPMEKISKFFPDGTAKEKIHETIVKALELWKQRERQKNEAR
jgi:ParB family chromosome partitioning protein